MAIDRNKITQQAEKLVVQGKLDAAIAQYEVLVRDNPRDMNTINKIGDLYARMGRKREAIAQFNKIGEHYAADGFFLKAIAIYKKITKLDPSHLEPYQKLADLYAQQGLVLEARSQYRTVAEQYLKAGDVKRGISAYQSLVSVDPDNLKQRVVLADLMAQDGRPAEAAEEYARVGAEMERKGLNQEARAIYQKAESVHPGSPAVVGRLAAAQSEAGEHEEAVKILREALRKSGDQVDLQAHLSEVLFRAGRHDEARDALRRAISLSPARMDLAVRMVRMQMARGDAAQSYETMAEVMGPMAREGKALEAAALLEEILEQDGTLKAALESLCDLYAAHGKPDKAVEHGHRLLDQCINDGDYITAQSIGQKLVKLRPGDAALREKLELVTAARTRTGAASGAPAPEVELFEAEEVLDIEQSEAGRAARAAPQPAGLSASPVELPAPVQLESDDEDFVTEHMTEADVFVKYGLADRAIEQLQAVTEKYPGYAPAHARLKEIYVEEGNREAARDQMSWLVRCHLAAGDRGAAEECLAELRRYDPACRQLALLDQAVNPGGLRAGMAIGSAADLEIEAGLDDALFETESAPRGGAGPQAREAGQDAAPSIEGLEEVDFYIDRRLRDEAVAVLRRLAEAHGSHPEIVSRMRKAMQLSVEPESIAPSPQTDGAEEFEISLDYSDQSSAIPASTASGPAGARADDGSIDLMDLASEVDAALSGHTADESTVISGDEAEPEGHSLEEIVQAFRKGIEKQVGAEDFDTHYSLGIAYKEMGLLDEAIGEFQFAAKDARLLVDCCSMLGVCFRDKGMPPLAVKWYRKGIDAANGREEEVVLGLRYDLADLLATMGEHRHAIELFTEIFGINSNYRDVAARIKELERTKSG